MRREVLQLTLGDIVEVDIASQRGIGLAEGDPLFVAADRDWSKALLVFVEQGARVGLGVVAINVEELGVAFIRR